MERKMISIKNACHIEPEKLHKLNDQSSWVGALNNVTDVGSQNIHHAVLHTSRMDEKESTAIKSFPTPSNSMRYMISIPINHSICANHGLMDVLGFDITPIIQSSNPGRSIGAKILSFVENSFNKSYNIRCGDELYKINNELIRVSPFCKIQDRLRELLNQENGTISITFERGSSVSSSHNPKPESILKIHHKMNSSEPKRVIFDGKPEICLYHKDDSKQNQCLEMSSLHNSTLSKDSSSCTSSLGPLPNRENMDCITESSYGEVDSSVISSHSESNSLYHGKILHTIFSPSIKGPNKPLCDDDSAMSMVLDSRELNDDLPSPILRSVSSTISRPTADDCWSYSTASSPVGVDIIEESESKMSEGKSFFSSPESSAIPTATVLQNDDAMEEYNEPSLDHTMTLAGIPSVVYRSFPQSTAELDDGSISSELSYSVARHWSKVSDSSRTDSGLHPRLSSVQEDLPNLLQFRATLQDDLEGKVLTMRNAVKTLEGQIFNQSREAKRKISNLESSKALAENEIIRLQSICVSSSKEAREIRNQLNVKQSELDLVKETLERERLTNQLQAEQTAALNSDLRAQVENLSKQLEIQKNKTASARQLAEMEVRQMLDAEIYQDKELIAELCAELKKANAELEELTEENEKLSKKIHELESKLKVESKQSPIIFGDIVRELAAAEAAASAIAKALVESESELAVCLEIQTENEKLIESMRKENILFQSQKMEFEDRILILSHELKRSNALVDKLSADIRGRPNSDDAVQKIKMEWSIAKLSYENEIYELKRSVEKYTTFIPKEEYARVKDESDRTASALALKLEEIKSLSTKITDLEDRLKQFARSEENHQSCHAGINVSDHSNRVISPSSSEGHCSPLHRNDTHDFHEMDDSDSSPVSDVFAPPPQVSPSSNNLLKFTSLTRREIIRAAGGHAAMNERLKKSRSAMLRLKESENELSQKTNPLSLNSFRSPLASIQGNGRSLAVRLASSHGKENVTCQ